MLLRAVLFVVLVAVAMGVGPAPLTARARPPSPVAQGAFSPDAAAAGMDLAQLQAAEAALRAGLPHVHSLVVLRRGVPAWESYYGGYRAGSRHRVLSVTKSVLAVLAGAAADRGLLNVDAPLAELLPDMFPPEGDRSLTTRHLLMLRSGLDWQEDHPLGRTMRAALSDVFAPLRRPQRAAPGSEWRYSSGDYQLVSAVLARATGSDTRRFADAVLFQPLGIHNWRWQTDRRGIALGGIGLALTPRDMAQFGHLVLAGGGSVTTPGWLAQITTPQPGLEPQPGRPGYGYGWWLALLNGQPAYYAAGFGGQLIVLVPGLELVVVMTGDETVSVAAHEVNGGRSLSFIENSILPAARP
jgi:CubicO group peptidase (beta-lactamase class C family)